MATHLTSHRTSRLACVPILALLLIAAAALALPAPPPPPDPGTIPSATLSLAIPAQVPLAFTATLSHTASASYTCTVRVGTGQAAGPVAVAPGEHASVALSVAAAGQYVANATCVSSQQGDPALGASAQFTAISDGPQLVVSVPAQSGSEFNATLWHTASGTYSCVIGIDLSTPQGALSSPFPLEEGQTRDIAFTEVPIGTHEIAGNCTGGAGTLVASSDVTVGWLACGSDAQCPQGQLCAGNGTCVASSQAAVVFPTQPSVTGPNVSITYYHTAQAPRSCTLTIDEAGWAPADPRWNDPASTRIASLSPSTSRTEAFSGVGIGTHLVHVRCAAPDGTDAEEAFAQFSVTSVQQADSGGVRVTLIAPGDQARSPLNVTFVHNATGVGMCNATIDGSVRELGYVYPYVASTFLSDVSQGAHTVGVLCASASWSARASRTVNVSDSTPAPTPALSIREGVGIAQGQGFSLVGTGFPSSESIGVTLAGGGGALSNTTASDASGGFVLPYAGLGAGSYAITAWDLRDDTLRASVTFSVTAPYVPPVQQPGGQGGPLQAPVIGQGNPRADAPGSEQQQGVQTGVRGAPDAGPQPTPQAQGNGTSDAQDPQQPSSGGGHFPSWILWLLTPLLVVGGALGWLAHNGALDFTSMKGLLGSIRDLREGGMPRLKKQFQQPGVTEGSALQSGMGRSGAGASPNSTLRSFIARERSKGFDDLTIRNALLRKGWDKEDVDSVFDDIYETQRSSLGR